MVRGRVRTRPLLLHITVQQQAVLHLVARGLTDKEIAESLNIAVPTVRTHLQRLYKENGFRNRTEAVIAWLAK